MHKRFARNLMAVACLGAGLDVNGIAGCQKDG